jgi:alpha-amylase/alpha-mannosidase (GH57 family)
MKRLPFVVATLLFVLAACSRFEPALVPTNTPLPITPSFYPTDTPTSVPDPIYLNVIWHFHQPFYTVDSLTGLVTHPWVRVNSTRIYYAMATSLMKFPKVHMTFNFSPVLLRQMNDISSGERDIYWETSARPSADLSDEDRAFILLHFFDNVDGAVIAQYPRYQELFDKRGGSGDAQVQQALQAFTEQDFRDLQVWFNLASFSTTQLSESPLKELVDKGGHFSEDDKRAVFEIVVATIRAINPLFAQLQNGGQAEISISAYGEPILPLLIDTASAQPNIPKALLPDPPFHSTQDADEQLKRAKAVYQDAYGNQPHGFLPTRGAVAPNVISPIATAGYEWTATGEGVLAASLKMNSFQRNADGLVIDADALYRPYRVTAQDGKQVAILFRDSQLSDLISSTYSHLDANNAAQDLINRLHAIKAELKKDNKTGPHLVTLIMDGDQVWRNYPDGGVQFIEALYQRLSDAVDQLDIQTITPAQYLVKFDEQRTLDTLGVGTWGDPGYTDYSTWIGQPESNTAWNNLKQAREFIDAYLTEAKAADPKALAQAYDAILMAEGADWFARNHPDNEGDAGYYDRRFNALLGQVYSAVGAPAPDFLQVPIHPMLILTGDQVMRGVITPTIDGIAEGDEWSSAGAIKNQDTSQSPVSGIVDTLYYGMNADNVYFRIDARDDWASLASGVDSLQELRVGVYIAKSGANRFSTFTRIGGDGELKTALGMSATDLLEWTIEPDGTSTTAVYAATTNGSWSGTATMFASGAAVGKVLELAAPIKALEGLHGGSAVNIVVVITRGGQALAVYPPNGLAQMIVPTTNEAAQQNVKTLGTFDDSIGDDHGPGNYTYPTDPVFEPGSFDLKRVTIAVNNKNLEFNIDLNGPINNVWNSPIGLSLQTIDIYIDKDPGKGTGERKLLPGRNASLPRNDGWEYALWIEGWNQQLLISDGKGNIIPKADVPLKVEIDPAGSATIDVPLSALGDGDPTTWGYAVVILGQEAYPSPGVWRVRDVDHDVSQWHFGGAPDNTNHTRIIDSLVPPGASPTQEAALSNYPSSQADPTKLNADQFGIVPLVTISK